MILVGAPVLRDPEALVLLVGPSLLMCSSSGTLSPRPALCAVASKSTRLDLPWGVDPTLTMFRGFR